MKNKVKEKTKLTELLLDQYKDELLYEFNCECLIFKEIDVFCREHAYKGRFLKDDK